MKTWIIETTSARGDSLEPTTIKLPDGAIPLKVRWFISSTSRAKKPDTLYVTHARPKS
jgi:hypothetical protein